MQLCIHKLIIDQFIAYQLIQLLKFSRLNCYIPATYLATVHYIFQTNCQETTHDTDMLVLCVIFTDDQEVVCVW